jgi:Protein of unknown function (DUF2490)
MKREKRMSIPRLILTVLLFMTVCQPELSLGQDMNIELWADYFGYHRLGYKWDYEGNAGVNKLITAGGWWDFYFANTFTNQRISWLPVDGALELHYTYDPLLSDVIEIRPFIEPRLIWQTYGKLRPYYPALGTRLETRFLYYSKTKDFEKKSRFRLRATTKVPLNSEIITAKTYFLSFLFEYFINIDGEAVERFASINRIMIGIGYAYSMNLRFEFMYYNRRSRNTIDEPFQSTDHMFQFLVRQYF